MFKAGSMLNREKQKISQKNVAQMRFPLADPPPLKSLSYPSPQRNEHLLIQGDTLKRSLLKKSSVDLIVTSPPYNVGKSYSGDSADDALSYKSYLTFTKTWLKNCFYWAKDRGRICVNVSIDKNKHGKQPLSADITTIAMGLGWKYHATILWNEGNISRRTAWGSWRSASAPHVIAPVEVVIVLYKGEWKKSGKGESDITGEEFKSWVLGIWSFNGESGKRIGHEAPFPRELPKRCIKLFSYKGDTVLDPFAGSGTTLIEAINRDRKAIGLEIEKNYCDLARERIKKECKASFQKSQAEKAGKSIINCWKI